MYPPTVEGVTIEWERKGQPGKLTFEVVKTPGLSFQEGDPCRFSVDGTPVFYGFVFEKSRKGNNPNVIKCVVYDQLYYLKNKDTYAYTKDEVDAKMSSALEYKGSKDTYADLPTTGNKKGDVWNIVNADAAHGVNAGDNVAWNGTTWDVLAGTVDLTAYMLASDLVAITNTELDDICK